jgi:hypothetical protein
MVLEFQDSLKQPETIVLALLKLPQRRKPKICTLT